MNPKDHRQTPETRGEAWTVSPRAPSRRQPADTLTSTSASGLRPPGCDYGWVSAPSSVLQDPSTHPRAGLAAPGGARAPPPKRARPASVEAPWALLAGLPLHLQSGFLWAPRPLRPGSAAREYGTLGRATRAPQEWAPVTAQPGPGCRWGLALAGAQGLPRSRLILAIEDRKPGQGELRDASQAR